MNEIDFILEQLKDMTAIDSPTGFTEYAAEHVMNVYKKMGYAPVRTAKGGIFIDLGGKNEDDAILLRIFDRLIGHLIHIDQILRFFFSQDLPGVLDFYFFIFHFFIYY